MAVLRMSVESVREVQSQMKAKRDELTNDLNQLNSLVNQTVGGDWTGQASSEFQQSFKELYVQLRQQLEILEELIHELDYEIVQWEEITARMG